METWIALLRGINVGGKHIVPMKELTKLMEDNGFSNVKTYIQSGNVVFDSETKPTDEISELVEGHFGFRPWVLVISAIELQAASDNNPFPTDIGKAVHFFFCDQTPQNVGYELLESFKSPTEEYKLVDNVFYLHAPDGIGRSKLAERIGRAFKGVTMTGRNLNTINKLIAMVT
ncbi:hypothetical protein BFP97_07375 [Roseivirga sp. 4D4]|uniref:DUF1697 domain-containing protein n=1 Tax=Roseivirga sp. 4D4 TaxID=1889784 RepID=UPI000852FF9A|nr:DUF1697 domain-containing protein [Roseivirga sp. 4D4]OEK01345.1 hypothetical protein BFP97_07375 [Roseivirga sp. 4D4]